MWKVIGSTGVAVAIFGLFVGLIILLAAFGVSSEVTLPMVAVGGVFVLLIALAAVAVSFSVLNIGDKTQALALPEGSIRAVIALTLILLFAILTVFLFGMFSSVGLIENVSETQLNALLNENPTRVVTSAEIKPEAAPAGAPAPEPGAVPAKRYNVYLEKRANPDATGFAKELLILLGTLVTSIASFYFGSKAAQNGASTSASASGPTIVSLSPRNVQRDGSVYRLTIGGSGLAGIRDVKVKAGGVEVAGTEVTASDLVVTFNLAIATDMAPGSWDVVASDGQGAAVALPAALNVEAVAGPEGEVTS